MAVVGEATVVVRAITDSIRPSIERAFRDLRGVVASEGEAQGDLFGRGFADGVSAQESLFEAFDDTFENLRGLVEEEGASQAQSFADGFSRGVDDSDISQSITRAVAAGRDGAQQEGLTQGQLFGEAFNDGIGGSNFRDTIQQSFAAIRGEATTAGSDQGSDYGDSFSQSAQQRLSGIAQSLRDFTAEIRAIAGEHGDAYGEEFINRASSRLNSGFDVLFGDVIDRAGAYGQASGDEFGNRFTDRLSAIDINWDNVLNISSLNSIGDNAGRNFGTRLGTSARNATQGAASGLGSLGRLISDQFGRGLTSGFATYASQAARSFQTLYVVGNLVAQGLGLLVGAINSAVSGLFALGAAAGAAVSGLVVLPGIIGAVIQGFAAIGVASRGVGQAIAAGFQAAAPAVGGVGRAATAATNQVANAERRLADVRIRNADRLEDANERVADAEQGLARAQREARIAQNGLNDARERAAESLQQLAFDVESAALSEERAVLNLQRASEELANVRANPASTAQELQEASLNYREAELALRRARDTLNDLEEAEKKAAKAGIEGSEEVLQQKEQIRSANERVADAQDALNDAERDRQRVIRDNARDLAEAQSALTQAINNQNQALGGGASAINKYQEALDKLSPAARSFVEYVVSLKDEFEALRTAAAEGLFPGVEDGLRLLVDNLFPSFETILFNTGQAVGQIAREIGELTLDPTFVSRIEEIGDINVDVLDDLGEALVSLIDGLTGVYVAARPVIDQFTTWVRNLAEEFQEYATSAQGISELTERFERAGETASQLGNIFRNIGSAFNTLVRGSRSGGQQLLDTFEDATEKLDELLQTAEDDGRLEDFFEQAADNFTALSQLIVDVTSAFGEFGTGESFEETAQILRGVEEPLREIFAAIEEAGPAFAQFLVNLADLGASVAESESIQIFFGILNEALEVLIDLLNNPVMREILAIFLPFAAAAKAVSLLGSSLKFFAGVVANPVFVAAGWLKALQSIPASAKIAQQAAATGSFADKVTAFNKAQSAAAASGRNLGGVIGLARLAFNPFGAAIAVAGAALFVFWKRSQEAQERVKNLTDALKESEGVADETVFAALAENLSDDFITMLDEYGIALEDYLRIVVEGKGDTNDLANELVNQAIAQSKVNGAIANGTKTEAEYANVASRLRADMEDRRNEVNASTAEYERHAAVMRATSGATGEYSDGLEALRGSADGVERALGAAFDELADGETAFENLNDIMDDTISNFSFLDESAISQERLNQRLAEGYENLEENLLGSSIALREQAESAEEGRQALLDQAAAAEESARSLDINTEAGRDARTAILDQVENLNALAQAELEAATARGDSAESLDAIREKYEGNIQGLKDELVQLGFNETAVDNYIESIEKTPKKKQTEFSIIIDTAVAADIISELDAVASARVAEIVAQIDEPSLEDVLAAIGEVAATDPTVEVSPEVLDLAFDATMDKLNELLVDPDTGQPRKPEFLSETDKATYDKTLEELEKLAERRETTIEVDDDGTAREVGGKIDNAARDRTGTVRMTGTVQWNFDDSNLPAGWRYNRSEGVIVTGSGGRIPLNAEGGPIYGPGGPKDDKILSWLSNGEFVLSAKSVKALGGMSAVSRLHKVAKSAGRQLTSADVAKLINTRMATGGVISPSSTGTIALLAEAGSAERVEPLDSQGLSARDRAIIAEIMKQMMGRESEEGGVSVSIGQIVAPTPQRVAREITLEMRAEAYRQGMMR